jgi:hypothetical protein
MKGVLYIREVKEKNVDGDVLINVKTFINKPNKFDYIVHLEN